jgi:hypothetical protein
MNVPNKISDINKLTGKLTKRSASPLQLMVRWFDGWMAGLPMFGVTGDTRKANHSTINHKAISTIKQSKLGSNLFSRLP